MVSGVLLGLFIIPVLFVVFQGIQERITGVPVAVLLDGDAHAPHIHGNSVVLQDELTD